MGFLVRVGRLPSLVIKTEATTQSMDYRHVHGHNNCNPFGSSWMDIGVDRVRIQQMIVQSTVD